MLRRIARIAVAPVTAALLVLGLSAAPALADTLVNVPASRVCHDGAIRTGIFAQAGTPTANRQYSIDVWSPKGDHPLHKQGLAPVGRWWFFYVKAWQYGTYHTVYHTWKNGTMYSSTFSSVVHYCG